VLAEGLPEAGPPPDMTRPATPTASMAAVSAVPAA